jgi:hypothetical protein
LVFDNFKYEVEELNIDTKKRSVTVGGDEYQGETDCGYMRNKK